jgi:hypothetical protein
MYFRILVVTALSMALPSAAATALDLSTPGSAVTSFFFDAYARGNVDDIVAARDFEFEARQELSGASGSAAPDEVAVKRTAKAKAAALRTRLQVEGTRWIDHSKCEHVTTWRLRDDVAKVILKCPGPTGGGLSGVLFEAMLAAKSAVGWRVVLDLDALFPLHPAR